MSFLLGAVLLLKRSFGPDFKPVKLAVTNRGGMPQAQLTSALP
ncbi:MAG: hypothetical protein NT113_22445 [Hyphomicrobiales bacterium]|jgi:hypothetical protein|nr:hypothetical protein [Hyphomicrobiales bacterium]